MASNQPAAKLERTLSLTSEPRTLTKEQYDLARAAASMQVFGKRNDAGSNDAAAEGPNAKPDREEGSAATTVKLPA